jgi:hypothetical protein
MHDDPRGRPVRLDYSPDERCQLNVIVPREIKRALAESAERNDRRLGDEARHALAEYTRKRLPGT